jgi:hypothetical protein
VEGTWNGLNQDHEGAIDVAAADPAQTRTSATTDSATSMTASTASRAYWIRADSSMPT